MLTNKDKTKVLGHYICYFNIKLADGRKNPGYHISNKFSLWDIDRGKTYWHHTYTYSELYEKNRKKG